MPRTMFRQKWFPKRKRRFASTFSRNTSFTGVSASTSFSAFAGDVSFTFTGVSASTNFSAFAGDVVSLTLTGVSASTNFSAFTSDIDSNISIIGVSASSNFSPFASTEVLEIVDLVGVQAETQYGSFDHPTGRVFLISGIKQKLIPPGVVMLPTSDNVPVQEFLGIGYAFGTSQFYTIGQVYWNSALRTEGTDYTFVPPFSHIIQFDPAGITTDVTLIYYRWDIGVRAGFKVNEYPVPFSFSGTSIIAENIPLQDNPHTGEGFFVVEYTSTRSSNNPMTIFARFPNIVDEIISVHTLYDESSGFTSYRRAGYKVFDTSDNNVWGWNGIDWYSIGPYSEGTVFFAKRSSEVYQIVGGLPILEYTAGDGPDLDIPEVLTYPPYGESIGKNLLVDAFSSNAEIDYPSAFIIANRPGNCEDSVLVLSSDDQSFILLNNEGNIILTPVNA